MLHLLDAVIEKVLDTGWIATPPPAKPGFYFAAPDENWRAKVKSGTDMRLDIYLYEVRENRDFRHVEWGIVRRPGQGAVLAHPPAHLDCHYLISAWSPAQDSEATTPTLDEHRVLAEALRVLLGNPAVTPATLGIPGGGPLFQQAQIYLALAAPEAPRVLNDFWSTMKLPWRPAIQLIATAPLDLLQDLPPAPLVTTFIQRYALIGGSDEVEEWIQIGGWVLSGADDTPIARAAAQRITPSGDVLEEVLTDAQGRYTFAGIDRGTHRLRAAAAGMRPVERDLDVPDGPPADHVFKLSPL